MLSVCLPIVAIAYLHLRDYIYPETALNVPV